jgi:hypothetical protein
MNDTKTRPAPPPLCWRCPTCSICGNATHSERGGFQCDYCNCWWDASGIDDDDDGEWNEPDAEQCSTTVQPYLDNTWIPDGDERKHQEYRCLLDAGHDNVGPDAVDPHANPDMTTHAKGWR